MDHPVLLENLADQVHKVQKASKEIVVQLVLWDKQVNLVNQE